MFNKNFRDGWFLGTDGNRKQKYLFFIQYGLIVKKSVFLCEYPVPDQPILALHNYIGHQELVALRPLMSYVMIYELSLVNLVISCD